MNYYGSLFHSDLFRMRVLTRSEILIYTTLVTHGGKKRELKYSQQKIADLAGVSLGSCKRALRKFEKLDWIKSATFYQIKVYTISIADVDQGSEPVIDQGSEPVIDQSYDLDQSNDPGVDHSYDLGIDHQPDPHVIENNKEKQSLHVANKDWSINSLLDATETKDEILFVQLFSRWSLCSKSNWSTYRNECPLSIYRNIRKATRDLLNHELEIKIIDSWLLMHRADRTGKNWRSKSWIKGMENWFKRQVEQGSRTDINRLSSRQKGFYDYTVTEMLIPDPPQTELNLADYRLRRVAEEEDQAEKDQLTLDPDLCTVESVRGYIKYISNYGSFSIKNHWGNIVARVNIRFPSLSPDDIATIEKHYPDINSIHESISRGTFRSLDMISWLEGIIRSDLDCGVDSMEWRSDQVNIGKHKITIGS